MGEVTVTVPLTWMSCWKCGINYMVPENWRKRRTDDGRSFWCPNGHGAVYPKDDETAEQKAEFIRHAHELEQAEAKIEDLTAQLKAAKAKPAVAAAAEPEQDDGPTIPAKLAGQLGVKGGSFKSYVKCPECDLTYKSRTCWAKHVEKAHGLDPVKAIAEIDDD
jgi:hypothetical protein